MQIYNTRYYAMPITWLSGCRFMLSGAKIGLNGRRRSRKKSNFLMNPNKQGFPENSRWFF
jgi:hypothetical protein